MSLGAFAIGEEPLSSLGDTRSTMAARYRGSRLLRQSTARADRVLQPEPR